MASFEFSDGEWYAFICGYQAGMKFRDLTLPEYERGTTNSTIGDSSTPEIVASIQKDIYGNALTFDGKQVDPDKWEPCAAIVPVYVSGFTKLPYGWSEISVHITTWGNYMDILDILPGTFGPVIDYSQDEEIPNPRYDAELYYYLRDETEIRRWYDEEQQKDVSYMGYKDVYVNGVRVEDVAYREPIIVFKVLVWVKQFPYKVNAKTLMQVNVKNPGTSNFPATQLSRWEDGKLVPISPLMLKSTVVSMREFNKPQAPGLNNSNKVGSLETSIEGSQFIKVGDREFTSNWVTNTSYRDNTSISMCRFPTTKMDKLYLRVETRLFLAYSTIRETGAAKVAPVNLELLAVWPMDGYDVKYTVTQKITQNPLGWLDRDYVIDFEVSVAEPDWEYWDPEMEENKDVIREFPEQGTFAFLVWEAHSMSYTDEENYPGIKAVEAAEVYTIYLDTKQTYYHDYEEDLKKPITGVSGRINRPLTGLRLPDIDGQISAAVKKAEQERPKMSYGEEEDLDEWPEGLEDIPWNEQEEPPRLHVKGTIWSDTEQDIDIDYGNGIVERKHLKPGWNDVDIDIPLMSGSNFTGDINLRFTFPSFVLLDWGFTFEAKSSAKAPPIPPTYSNTETFVIKDIMSIDIEAGGIPEYDFIDGFRIEDTHDVEIEQVPRVYNPDLMDEIYLVDLNDIEIEEGRTGTTETTENIQVDDFYYIDFDKGGN